MYKDIVKFFREPVSQKKLSQLRVKTMNARIKWIVKISDFLGMREQACQELLDLVEHKRNKRKKMLFRFGY